MAFTQKLLSVQVELAQGVFDGGGNTANITGARISLKAFFPSGKDQGTAEIAIYGLPLTTMNQLSTVGNDIDKIGKNGIGIYAGESGGAMTLVYQGNIINAFVDGNAMPEVAFRITAAPGTYQAVKPAKPLSIKGSADVASTLKNIAGQMGLGFENTGVNAKLANPYFGGSLWTQALAIARHAGIYMTIEKGSMVIVKPGQSRQGSTPLISPETGMVGYPAFNQGQVIVACLFNPEVQHFGNVEIKSSLTSANGIWNVVSIELDLESMVFNGRWFMVITCAKG